MSPHNTYGMNEEDIVFQGNPLSADQFTLRQPSTDDLDISYQLSSSTSNSYCSGVVIQPPPQPPYTTTPTIFYPVFYTKPKGYPFLPETTTQEFHSYHGNCNSSDNTIIDQSQPSISSYAGMPSQIHELPAQIQQLHLCVQTVLPQSHGPLPQGHGLNPNVQIPINEIDIEHYSWSGR